MTGPRFIAQDNAHFGDGDSLIVRRTIRVIDGTLTVVWELPDPGRLDESDLYVKQYSKDGEVSHYVRLDVMIDMIEYSKFCHENGIKGQDRRKLISVGMAIIKLRSR